MFGAVLECFAGGRICCDVEIMAFLSLWDTDFCRSRSLSLLDSCLEGWTVESESVRGEIDSLLLSLLVLLVFGCSFAGLATTEVARRRVPSMGLSDSSASSQDANIWRLFADIGD
jgi:hypothetical protein